MADGERILLGRIVAAHGIRGDVLVRTYTDAAEAIGSYGALTDADGRGSFKLRVLRVTAKGVVAHLAGVSDRNGAEALAGTDLYVARAQLPAAEEGAFYHADLIGLVALAPDGTEVGRIVGVQPTDRVARFLDKAGLLKREARNNPEKAKPGKKRLEREAAAAEAAAKAAEAASAEPSA